MLTEKAIRFLENRKLDPELAAKHGLSSVIRHGTEWLAIPYYDGETIVNHKYRALDDKQFEQDKGGEACFWNKNVLSDPTLPDPLVVTEGELDALAAIQCGFTKVLSVPNGAPSQELEGETSKYNYLVGIESKNIILAVDNDNPGANLLHDLSLRLGPERCKWVKYPKRRGDENHCKDLNEVLMLYGEAGVRETISRAAWVKSDGVYKMDELPPVPEAKALTIGFAGLDNHYRIRKGDFCVVTGLPSHGKSSYLNDLACRMVSNHGWRVAFASFEQKPQTDHKNNLLTWRLKKYPSRASAEELQSGLDWINKNFRFIVPSDDDSPDLEWILSRCAMCVTQHDCDMIIIDPWNEMEHRRGDETLTEYVGNAIKAFKRLARKLNVHLIVAAHPAKMRRENGVYLPPSLYDISDSAHWSNKADVGITIYRPDIKVNLTEIHVVKVRYQPSIGSPGTLKMHFLPDQSRYEWAEM